MKRLLLLILALSALIPFSLSAQVNPPAVSAFQFSGGVWTALTTGASSGQLTYQPPAAALALYCFNSGTQKWVAADSSCNFGSSGTVSQRKILLPSSAGGTS